MENINNGIAYSVGGHMYGVMGGDKIMAEFEKDLPELPKLKACPFCGSKDIYIYSSQVGISYVRCPICNYLGDFGFSEEQAVKLWNMIKTREESKKNGI